METEEEQKVGVQAFLCEQLNSSLGFLIIPVIAHVLLQVFLKLKERAVVPPEPTRQALP